MTEARGFWDWRRGALAAAATAALFAAGCVERTLTIRSEPSGAFVSLDGRDMGRTPVTTRFSEYGGREISVWPDPDNPAFAAGYLRDNRVVQIKAPVYQWFGPDLFFELLYPWTLHDNHEVTIKLTPAAEGQLDPQAVKERAEQMESAARKAKEADRGH
ncbi:MAG TPA: PEGA domain-containing protein [Candidatus Brocadiia bacterium]|nr:PEGA domain-containing protein [Candidatus Brocadiia bacterium]